MSMPTDINHEQVPGPNWETKILCGCGERCSIWMEFYRHRGDAYRVALSELYDALGSPTHMEALQTISDLFDDMDDKANKGFY